MFLWLIPLVLAANSLFVLQIFLFLVTWNNRATDSFTSDFSFEPTSLINVVLSTENTQRYNTVMRLGITIYSNHNITPAEICSKIMHNVKNFKLKFNFKMLTIKFI